MTPAQAQACLDRLRLGYMDSRSGSGYPPATTNDAGCLLAQKAPNRADNGYVQIAPLAVGGTGRGRSGTKKAKPLPQGAHRLVVRAFGR